MPDAPIRIAVVGGGIAGLVAARDLARAGAEVVVFEAEDRLGGKLRAAPLGSGAFDIGAEAFATRTGAVAEYLGELGLADRVCTPAPLGSWCVAGGRAYAMPESGVLGIPAAPLSAAGRRALGLAGALRAAVEPLLHSGVGRDATSLAELVESRLGRRVLDRLVRPVALGVYSSDPADLPVSAAPGLAPAYAEEGSLLRAARRLRDRGRAAGSAVGALPGGMAPLVAALESELRGLGVAFRLGAAVTALTEVAADAPGHTPVPASDAATDAAPGPAAAHPAAAHPASAHSEAAHPAPSHADAIHPAQPGWRIETATPAGPASCGSFDGVLLAVPERQARTLLRAEDSAATPADQDPQLVEVIALLVSSRTLSAAPRGTGALVAPGGEIRAKALTHVTAKWPDRAGSLGVDEHVIRLSYGRRSEAPATLALDDDAARAQAIRDAALILGVPLSPDEVTDFARRTWEMPAPPAASAAELPAGLLRSGDAVAGTGLAATIPHARRTARDLFAQLSARTEPTDRTDSPHTTPAGAAPAPHQEHHA
ncbi:FAD-dependent oxidoreductase [Leucobacter sp. CSA2]|uniref:FAD-dependent oxidoreductase n=1 Tax=Leucobacter edaphi TaxID=2796472 RepID=A0A934QDL0_9MICO|nr:FAD-dependent oxidoreductase [Leucobacter edaphi]MBK0422263.1 FAD-dependent oxidoreductase [Leucobacter edaphi]